MNSPVSQLSWSKLAAIGLLASAFALGGCGRKGPLDLPPNAAATPAATEGTSQSTEASGSAADGTLFAPAGSGSNHQMVAPRGEKKRIFLDPLLE